jgi:3-oxoacyl-[acyl-carrier-protein] synthase II
MNNEVVITGIGLLSCLGNLQQSWQALIKGDSGISFHQPFVELPSLPLGLIGQKPIDLETLTKLVVADAIADAGLNVPLVDCGVVVGSSRGCQSIWEELMRSQDLGLVGANGNSPLQNSVRGMALPCPYHWLESLPNCTAIATARFLGATGVVLSPMAACSTGLWALSQAFDLIASGRYQRVVAGAIEAPITRMTIAGFESMGALAKTGCYPFDRDREGLVLGEGGAIFVLESAELALDRGAKIYGRVLGFSLTCDAYHLSAPNVDNRSALLAIKQCLDESKLYPQDIDFIYAHGTSTQLNDRNEAQLIQYLFPQGVPVSSTKGSTGHTLGASGAISAAFGLMSLQHQLLPPCVGLKESDFNLDVITSARHCLVKNLLCLSFGFGGQNTATILSC